MRVEGRQVEDCKGGKGLHGEGRARLSAFAAVDTVTTGVVIMAFYFNWNRGFGARLQLFPSCHLGNQFIFILTIEIEVSTE